MLRSFLTCRWERLVVGRFNFFLTWFTIYSQSPLRKESIRKADVVDGSELCVDVLRRAEVARQVSVLMMESLVALLEELYFRGAGIL